MCILRTYIGFVSWETLSQMLCFSYRQARTVIETIFGPRCHKDFPRLFRLADEYCSGDGFYPSNLGRANTEYKHKGIDIITESETVTIAQFL